MEEESVGYELQAALKREDGGEEVIKVAKRLKQLGNRKDPSEQIRSNGTYNVDVRLGSERVFAGQEGRRDEDADEDDVGTDGVSLDSMTPDSEPEHDF